MRGVRKCGCRKEITSCKDTEAQRKALCATLARTMIPLNDIWIAATALAIGANLVTHNNHFQHVKNLVTVDWTPP